MEKSRSNQLWIHFFRFFLLVARSGALIRFFQLVFRRRRWFFFFLYFHYEVLSGIFLALLKHDFGSMKLRKPRNCENQAGTSASELVTWRRENRNYKLLKLRYTSVRSRKFLKWIFFPPADPVICEHASNFAGSVFEGGNETSLKF